MRTWVVEAAVVLAILVGTALVSQQGAVEWLGVASVWGSFLHGQVADRLSEAERARMLTWRHPDRGDFFGPNAHAHRWSVSCWRWERRYFLAKELGWIAYFIALGGWSGLVGAVVFALYRPWRALWRRLYPIGRPMA